jgi:hypothetical protein
VKPHHHIAAASAEMPNTRQRLFSRYLIAILVDLLVLNLFAEHWQRVAVDGFTLSLVVAVLLQLLLQLTLVLEHRVGGLLAARAGAAWTAVRLFAAWLILFGSKFVMLWAIDLTVGDAVRFTGPLHGAVALVVVIAVMVLAEEVIARIYRALA